MVSPSTSLTEENLGIQCWNKFKKQWTKAIYTPFIVCLCAGNLNIDAFNDFLVQNVHFLRAFERVYEMAEEFTDDDNAKVMIRNIRESVHGEIKMQEEWLISLPGESIPSPATIKYRDFMLATASGKLPGMPDVNFEPSFKKTKLPAYIVGAMAPLMRLYAFLGKELQTLADVSFFCKFQEATLQAEGLLDQLSVSFTREELNIIEKLYGQAIELQTEFFLAHTPAQRTAVPLAREHNPDEHCLLLFSDFDLTCTDQDSPGILVRLAIAKASDSEESQSEDQSESQLVRMSSALRSKWTKISDEYIKEFEKCLGNILVSVPSKGESFDYEGLRKGLEIGSKFYKEANARVIRSGVLKGLNINDIILEGQRIILQDGCTNFFQSVVNNEKLTTGIHIVSDCWCHDLIKSCFASGGLGSVKISANELIYQGELSTGEILTVLESPIDKVRTFRDRVVDYFDDRKNLTVCIGDSVDDLLCLLEADVGILVGPSSAGLKVLVSHFGISLILLWQGVIERQKLIGEGSSDWKGSRSGVLYTVSSWTEIHSFVLGW